MLSVWWWKIFVSKQKIPHYYEEPKNMLIIAVIMITILQKHNKQAELVKNLKLLLNYLDMFLYYRSQIKYLLCYQHSFHFLCCTINIIFSTILSNCQQSFHIIYCATNTSISSKIKLWVMNIYRGPHIKYV